MSTQTAEYDAIGDRYSEAKTAPFRIHLEAYTLERLAGDVTGARVLDVACGDGFYSRRLARLGAKSCVGVDASREMVALGERAEAGEPLGCRYVHADVTEFVAPGQFDVVVAAYLLNYARSLDEMRRWCEILYANLAPGGRLVGVNDYTADPTTTLREFDRHGFRKTGPGSEVEGDPITYEFLLPGGRSFAITNYYWHPHTYMESLAAAGFRQPEWHSLQASPEDRFSFRSGFWDDLISESPLAAFRAER